MNNWERNLRDKLNSVSPEGLDYHVAKEQIWKKIAKPKRKTIWLLPALTHTAAVIAGVILSGVFMFLLFKNTNNTLNPKARFRVSNAPFSQPDLVFLKKESDTAPFEQSTGTQHNALRKQPEVLNRKQIKKRNNQSVALSSERMEEKAESNIHPISRQVVSENKVENQEKPIAYWSDINEKYAQPQAPSAWVKIRKKFSRSDVSKTDSINKIPLMALTEAFR